MSDIRNLQARMALDKSCGRTWFAEVTSASVVDYEIEAEYTFMYFGAARTVTVQVITFVDFPAYTIGEDILIIKGIGEHPHTGVYGHYWFDVNVFGRIPSSLLATPVDTAAANAEGTDETFVRGDHVHKAVWLDYPAT